MVPHRFAIILTHNRPQLLKECVAAVGPQCDVVIVIDNASQPAVEVEMVDAGFGASYRTLLVTVPDQPPNLAALWNVGFDLANNIRADEPGPWWIAVLCDDALVPDGWYQAVVDAMTATGAAAGCSNPRGLPHPPQVKTAPDGDIFGRMPGWAFILDGTKQLRADETMHWWFSDTSLDFTARQAGGMVMIGSHPVPNRLPNDFTNSKPELAEQAGRDRQRFAEVWGFVPW